MDQETELSIEIVESMLRIAKRKKRPIIVDWVNRHISILSEPKPTFKANGDRLILSDGPAFHREIVFRTSGV